MGRRFKTPPGADRAISRKEGLAIGQGPHLGKSPQAFACPEQGGLRMGLMAGIL